MEDMRRIPGAEKKGGGDVFVNKGMPGIWMTGVKQISRLPRLTEHRDMQLVSTTGVSVVRGKVQRTYFASS